MNDDDLLFGVDEIELMKRRMLPEGEIEDRTRGLIARFQAQSQQFNKLLASASPALALRLKKRL